MAENIRVRIAPSPTGKFHIGTARTALFNYLFAKKNEGKFVVRIEDTDRQRSEEQYTRDILDGLLWLGMPWDEGPEVEGPFKPYSQSQRLDLYKQHVNQLLEAGRAYKCFCTPEELTAEREDQQAKGQAPKYSGKCRSLTKEQVASFEKEGKKFAIRFIVEPKKVSFDDLIKGTVEFDSNLIGDFPVIRSDGMPLFILTNVIDDNQMQITHVLRGEDHLSNTAKQILLAEALNFLSPEFGHFPMILNANRSKMSKRKDPVSVTDDFKKKGYLPEALVNFIALLGWAPGNDREIFSMKELIDEFEVERVGHSPAIFDPEKLLWMNGYYIRQLPVGELASRAQQFITNKEVLHQILENPEYFMQVISLIQDRLKTLDEVEGLIEFFYREPTYKADLLIAKKSTRENALAALEAAQAALQDLSVFTFDETEVALRGAAKDKGLKDGELLWTVRVALTGKEASPGVFELLGVFGKAEALKRLAAAQQQLTGRVEK